MHDSHKKISYPTWICHDIIICPKYSRRTRMTGAFVGQEWPNRVIRLFATINDIAFCLKVLRTRVFL